MATGMIRARWKDCRAPTDPHTARTVAHRKDGTDKLLLIWSRYGGTMGGTFLPRSPPEGVYQLPATSYPCTKLPVVPATGCFAYCV